eukprot:3869397-Prymnesium_polylepis.1
MLPVFVQSVALSDLRSRCRTRPRDHGRWTVDQPRGARRVSCSWSCSILDARPRGVRRGDWGDGVRTAPPATQPLECDEICSASHSVPTWSRPS